MTAVTFDNVRPIGEDLTEEERALLAHPENWGTAEERVARGASFLDRTMPDWAHLVEINDLDLQSQCNCVLGQIFHNTSDEIAQYVERARNADDVEYFFRDEDIANQLERRGFDLGELGKAVRSLDGYGLGLQVLKPLSEASTQESTLAASMFGFDVTYNTEDERDDDSPSYGELTTEWRMVVAARTGRTI